MYHILESIHAGLKAESDKIQIIDHNRIMYLPSTIEICMNGHETVFSRGGETIGTGDDLDDRELKLIYAIRGIINPHDGIISRREKMAEYFTSKEILSTPDNNSESADYKVNDDVEPFDL